MTVIKKIYKNKKNCQFCEKEILSDKVRDHFHLTGNYRGPELQSCNVNVTQKQSNFILFIFHNCINYDCHLCFEMLVDEESDQTKFDIVPKTNKQYKSVLSGCIRGIDSYQILSMGLNELVKNLDNDDFNFLRKNFRIKAKI